MTHTCFLRQSLRAATGAAEDGDIRGAASPGAQQPADHGPGHAACSDEGEFGHGQSARIAASSTVQAWSMSLPSWAVERNAVS